MKKFAEHLYGGCKEIVLGGPTASGFATGLIVTYLWGRSWGLIKRTRDLEEDYMVHSGKHMESVKSSENSACSANKGLEKHAETLRRYFQTET